MYLLNAMCVFQTVKKPTKFDRVVRREICRITSKGTRTFGIIDGETNDAENSFLIAISEQVNILKN